MIIRRSLAIATFAAAVAAAPLPSSSSADSPCQTVEVGHVRLTIAPWKAGVTISCDDVEVSRGSGLVVTTPPWAPHYYLGPSEAAVRNARRERVPDGERITLQHEGDHGAFRATETFTVTADGRIEQRFEGVFVLPDAEALIQWQIAGLNPTLMIGRPYRAQARGTPPVAGVVPVVAASPEPDASALSRQMDWIEFDSRIGPLRIDVETEHNRICYDQRANRWADAGDPRFWFGDLGTRFKSGQPIRYRIIYSLPAAHDAQPRADDVEGTLSVRAEAQAQTGAVPDAIIPTPKEIEWLGDMLGAGESGALAVRCGATDPAAVAMIEPALREFAARYRETTGKDPAVGDDGPGITFELAPRSDLRPEEYWIEPLSEGLAARARDAAGFRHAARTLSQLVFVGGDQRIALPRVRVRDWPTLRFRGVHLFTGGRGPELHHRLIRNVISALKLNQLVLEAEYVEWDAFPEIHHPEFGMPKQEVRAILATARACGVEVIPLINVLGHAQWMFTGDNHLDLAEDPEARWAYCVTNPATYDFVFQVFEEALELFQPRILHIGHDEFHDRGRVPFRASSKPFTVEQLFLQDTLRLHAWLKQRGVRTAMWGDMLLGPRQAPDACNAKSIASAEALRQALPDDVLITDWHYGGDPPAAFTSLTTFQQHGHEVVAAAWNRPANITNFARAAAEQNALGFLQTTWAGYSLDPASFERELPQYMAYVLAAEAAWNGGQPPLDVSAAGDRFLSWMGMSSLTAANRGGATIDLTPVANCPLAAADDRGWFGLGPAHDAGALPAGRARLRGLLFDIPTVSSRPAALALAGRLTGDLTLPRAAVIRADFGQPQTLALLLTAPFAGRLDEPVAVLEASFADGARATTELRYGRQIFAYSDLTPAAEAPIVWTGRTRAGGAVAVRAFLWDLPEPRRQLISLSLRSLGAAPSPVVIAVTALDASGDGPRPGVQPR